MTTLGIRAAPKSVTFAILDPKKKAVINVEDLIVPEAFSIPDALKYIRHNLLDIMREYEVTKAGVRVSEPSSQNLNILRIHIEGVVQEAFASSMLEDYYAATIATMSARLGVKRGEVKPLIDGETDPGIENWGTMKKHQREAILAALGAANA